MASQYLEAGKVEWGRNQGYGVGAVAIVNELGFVLLGHAVTMA